ncbi:PilW family protein [Thioalkalivibrio sp. ALJT]|uniref:PilW family protein n=1 Tax=Thioalkalivibrio sp. ALJT TaxID=1158146 RepID=UPI00036CB53D|nr:PilW family protein [Thioalkalivibrio sp. ALJT]
MSARRTPTTSFSCAVRGLTLVELMVAMLIGLLLIGGTISIFISTQQTYRTQEAMSRVQESGRFAIERIARDAREAGYLGCPGTPENWIRAENPSYNPNLHDVNRAFVDGDAPSEHVRGDILTISSMRSLNDADTFEMDGSSAPDLTLEEGDPASFNRGWILRVADSESGACEVFQNAAATDSPGLVRGIDRDMLPGNFEPEAHVGYSPFSGQVDIRVLKQRTYFIGTTTGGTIPGLFRRTSFTNATGGADVQSTREIASGIYDMRLEYGLDDNGDGHVNRYQPTDAMSSADWERTAAVRVHLLVHNGEEDNVVDQPRTNLYFVDDLFNAPDRRLYQTFTTTIAARNRLE